MNITLTTGPMAINILETPNEIDYTRNPIGFKVEGTGFIAVTGNKSEHGLYLAGPLIDGQSFLLEWGDESVNFLVVTGPVDDSGTQISATSSAAVVANRMLQNHALRRDFDIVVSAPYLNIVAREEGPQFDITFTGLPGDLINYVNIGGTDTQLQTNYQIAARLFVQEDYIGGGDFIALPEAYCDVDDNGQTIVPVGNMLTSFFQDRDLPAFIESGPQACANMMRRYKLEFTEFYGIVPVGHKVYSTDTFYGVNARCDFDLWPSSTFFLSSKLLSNLPVIRNTIYSTPQYLYVYNYSGTSSSLLQNITINYTDGTSFALTLYNVTPAGTKNIFRFQAGADQLALNIFNPTKVVRSYTVAIKRNTPNVTLASVTYNVIPDQFFQIKTFLWENNYGAFETLLCTGDVKRVVSTEKDTFRKNIQKNYSPAAGQYFSDFIQAGDEYEVNTGYKTKAEIDALAEMFSNKYFYLVGSSSFIKCDLVPGSQELGDDSTEYAVNNITFRIKVSNDR